MKSSLETKHNDLLPSVGQPADLTAEKQVEVQLLRKKKEKETGKSN